MNKIDIENLQFIIQKQLEGSAALDEWLKEQDDDNLQYALTLLKTFVESRQEFVDTL